MAVVLNDLFTTGTDANIEVYNSIYDIIFGNNNLTVNSSLGAVVSSSPNVDQGFRIQSGPGSLTGDYQVDIVTRYTANSFGGYCVVRGSATGACYDFDCESPTTGVYRVWKSVSGGNFTQVATFTGGPTPGLNTDFKLSAKVTGTSPVVIDCYCNDILVGTYTDANADRLQTGNPGAGLYSDGGTGVQITSITVDDLSSGSTLQAYDSFTAVNGTLITNRTTDSSHTWSLAPGSTGTVQIQSGKAVDTVFNGPEYYSSYVPFSPDYTVELTVSVDAATAFIGGPSGRINPANGDSYSVVWNGGAQEWRLQANSTVLGTYVGDVPTTPRVLSLRMQGTSIKLFIDGIERISVVNSTFTSAGRPGAVFSGGATTRTHDDWKVYEVRGFEGSTLKYWNNSFWLTGKLKRWNGSQWVPGQIQRWNGSSWVNVP